MLATFTWFRVHSFTGVVTGLMLFVICWSGSFAVISHELDWFAQPAMGVEPQGQRASWGEIQQAARRAEPNAEVGYMEAPRNVRACATVYVTFDDGGSKVLLVDPYTAEVRGDLSGYTIQRFFRSFHTNLFEVGGVGDYLVMAFALVILASLVSALVFFKRWWKRFFTLPRGRGQAWWSGLHKSVGLWSLWFLLLMTVTGAWYLFEALRVDIGDGVVNYVDDAPYGLKQVRAAGSDPLLPPLPLDEVIGQAKQQWPEFKIGTIAYCWYAGGRDVVYLEGQTAGFSMVRDRANQMHLDPRTGEVLWQNSAADLTPYWIWSNMADPLHFGDFGGLWSKAVWFIFGLALCGLILTGTYLHAQRLAKDSQGRHRWPGTMAAIFVTLIVLAASVPAGFQEARESYGPVVNGVKQLPSLAPGVKAVIICWVALTGSIIGGWCCFYDRSGFF